MDMQTNKTPWPKKFDDGSINLHGHFDAQVWAEEFMRITQGKDVDEDTMRAWFANAIMTGHDHANWANGKLPNCSLPWPE